MAISRQTITAQPVGGTRTAIVAWCLFDWANSAFPTIIVTFVFAAYFTNAVAPNPELGTALWGQANSVLALAAAVCAPLLGAIADQGGRRKPWLLMLSLICILATASLWFVRPDPSSMVFALVAYGGAGPLHAVAVAREIGIRKVIIPGAPGVFSAFGMLFSDLRYDYVRTHLMQLADAPFDEVEAVFGELEQQGRDAIASTSVRPHKIAVKRALDMRYVGHEHPVAVELPMSVFAKQDRKAIKQAAYERAGIETAAAALAAHED